MEHLHYFIASSANLRIKIVRRQHTFPQVFGRWQNELHTLKVQALLQLPYFNINYLSFTTLDRFQNFPVHDSYYVTIADEKIMRVTSFK